MRRILSGIMAFLTVVMSPFSTYASDKDNKVAPSAIYGSRINMSINQESVKYSPQYFNPNELNVTSSSTLSVMDIPGLSTEEMENMRKIVSGLQDLNLSNAMLAGILGNLRQESNFKPSALSDSKTYYGLVQWGKERRTALETIPDYDTVEGQVKFLKAELQGTAPATGNYGATLDKYLSRYDSSNMQTVTDVEMACEAFCVVVEGCTGGKAENKNKAKDGKYYQDLGQRKDYAKEIYNYLEIGNISVEASEQAKEFLSIASSKLGCPYVWGAKGPNSFDCSGYVWWCLNQAGVNVPYRTTANWISDKPFPQVTSYDDLRAGDVMLISGHIVIIVGDGTIMDASSSNGKVVHRNLSDWWRNHFVVGYRIFN